MRTGLVVMVALLATCAMLLLVAEEGHAQVDLNYTDDQIVKVAQGRNPIVFNFTVMYTGTAPSADINVQLESVPPGWPVFLFADPESGIAYGSYNPSTPLEFLMARNEMCNLSMTITPGLLEVNRTYWFNLTASLEVNPSIRDSFIVGVVIPQRAGFELVLWDPPPEDGYTGLPLTTVTITLALFNMGNGVDRFLIAGTSSRSEEGWTLSLRAGVNATGYTPDLPPDLGKANPYLIKVTVSMPAGVPAETTATVHLNCTSMFNRSVQRPPVLATVRALQFYNYEVLARGPDAKAATVGSEVRFQGMVVNHGNGMDTFIFEFVSDEVLNPGFSGRVEPPELSLGMDGQGEFELVILVPGNASKKTYDLGLNVTSSGPLPPIQRSFHVSVPQFFAIETSCEDNVRDTVLGGNLEFDVTVRNAGNGLDAIQIGALEGVPEGWLTYTQPPEVTLLQDQMVTVKVIVIVPSSAKYAPGLNYTLTFLAHSTRSDAEASLDLLVNIAPFNWIEWTHLGEEITNPSRPTAYPGTVRPRPEIDLYVGTECVVTLGILNLGNVPDEVPLGVEISDPRVEVLLSHSVITVAPGFIEEVTILVKVSRNIAPGVHAFTVSARSEDLALTARKVPLDFEVVPVYPTSDFESLGHTDPVGDDYAFHFEAQAKDGSSPESWGRVGREPGVDIVSLAAEYDPDTGMVTVTETLSGDVIEDEAVMYYLCFVTEDHTMGGPLLDPRHYDGEAPLEGSFGSSSWLAWWEYSNGRAGSLPPSGLPLALVVPTVEVRGNIMEFTMDDKHLRWSVDPDSGFHLYAFAFRAENGTGWTRITWDSAGLGAAAAPEGFRRGGEESPDRSYLAPAAIFVAALSAFLLVRHRQRGRGPDPSPRQ